MTAVGVVAFVVALLVSVMLHEAGHFLTARHYGMKATQFFVGFGPTLFSRRRGETEYGIKAIPAGGFVKIVGMTPLEELAPGDERRAFFRQPAGRRTVVLAAGSTVHFLIAIVLVAGVSFAIGTVDDKAPVLTAPLACVQTSITSADQVAGSTSKVAGHCPAGTIPGIAAAAGLQVGDRVVRAGGRTVTTYRQFTEIVRGSAGTTLDLVVRRDGRDLTLPLTPALVTRPDFADLKRNVQVGAIGIGQDPFVLKHLGPVAAVKQTGATLGTIVTGTYDTLTKKLATIGGIYGKHRDPTGVVGVVGAARVSGEIINAPVPFAVRVADFLLLMAGLNLFVGVFNLLPLLPLDGGHIAVLGFEQARDKLRRARGYVGELQRVDLNKLTPVTLAVVALFIGFTVFVLGADIVNPIKLGG